MYSSPAHAEFGGSDPVRQAPAVLEIIPRLEAGGTARAAVDLALALVRSGGKAVVASEGGRLLPDVLWGGAVHQTLKVDTDSPWSLLKLGWQLARLAKREQVEIFHARSAGLAWAISKAKRFADKPLVVTIHDRFEPARLSQRWYADAVRNADHVIAVSDYIGNHVKATLGVPGDRLTVIPRGINLGKFNPGAVKAERLIKLSQKWLLPDGVPLIIMSAALAAEKGHGLLIEALAAIKDQPFHCLIVGDDSSNPAYRRMIEELIVDKGLAGKVRFGGFCDDMPAAYMLADLVVSPSAVAEAFALTAIEAQAMGRPVVATNHGSAGELVLNGKTGWLVTPNDPSAFAAAVTTGLSLSPSAREGFALAARAYTEQHFALEAMCTRTFEIYHQVLDKAAAGSQNASRSA